jgi:hypothetical protein
MGRGAAWGLRVGAVVGAAVLAAIYAGCNDLVVPSTSSNDGGGGGNDGSPGNLDGDTLTDALGVDAGPNDARSTRLDCSGQDAAFGAPNDLGCTGLYSDWAKRVISADAKDFDPGVHLLSDGAEKSRWIAIPAGQKVDTTDMNEWRFPVGTKLWEEFKISGRRVETRHFWKRGDNDWVRTTYRWTDDETAAVSLAEGATNLGVRGTTYVIPTVAQCDTCHSGRIDRVLGFEAVSLSTPTSKYAGQSPAMVGVAPLLSAPPGPLVIPNDSSGKAEPALGWLHANCGTTCHNPSPSSFAGVTGLFLRLEVGANGLGAYVDTSTYRTAVCQAAHFRQDPPLGLAAWTRIRPHEDWTRSLIPFRDSRRNDPFVQMPPLASSIPDLAGSKLVQDWVMTGSFPQQTGLGEKCP